MELLTKKQEAMKTQINKSTEYSIYTLVIISLLSFIITMAIVTAL